MPSKLEFLIIMSLETIHVVGLAVMVYLVLPNLKVVEAVMLTNCVCVVPGILNMFTRQDAGRYRPYLLAADTLALLAQLSGLFLWAALQWSVSYSNLVWILPFSLLFVSVGWWENYVDKSSPFGISIKNICFHLS